ncbi:hypothetical protein JCM21900_001641 [Sporobolomyces salmonicolor]|uniref:SPOSA6832_04032-mRNA-1:cds n=1 Tax=Sporidiobolus salmonicolor TaxID=5005 RepID=A0A0D6ER50_SPOSA|nr:SPOSA6832_04032 [Sporobolomyces salmonicolor]
MSFAKAASADPIQSISVPSYSRVSKPEAHILYTIAVSLPSRSYSVQQRYSAFTTLQQTLNTSCGAPPPGQLPPKHPSSWLNPFRSARDLTDDQLNERRTGLELWLRGILADQDPRWRSSRAFKEFLAAPPGGGASSGKGLNGLGDAALDRDWTPTGWTEEFTALEASARELRTLLDKRDSLLLANSASAHASAKEAKAFLVDVVQHLGMLTRALEVLAQKGMTDGELSRRSGMVQRMQGEVEDLGRKAGNAPRVGASRTTAGGRQVHDESPSVARQALLGSKMPSRVLGPGAAGLETPETRPLDNQGVMSLQQQYMDDQDSKLESLTAALRRQRHLGEMINQELALQEDVIDQLERGTDRVSGKIKDAQKQMKRL